MERVGAFHLEGTHRARQNDGDGWVFDLVIEVFAGLAEGVCAVEDDDPDAVGGVVFGAGEQIDGSGDSSTVRVGEIERIFGHQLESIDVDVL